MLRAWMENMVLPDLLAASCLSILAVAQTMRGFACA